jgi:hypothetical protein
MSTVAPVIEEPVRQPMYIRNEYDGYPTIFVVFANRVWTACQENTVRLAMARTILSLTAKMQIKMRHLCHLHRQIDGTQFEGTAVCARYRYSYISPTSQAWLCLEDLQQAYRVLRV